MCQSYHRPLEWTDNCDEKKCQLSNGNKIRVTFHYTAWFIEIFITAYCNRSINNWVVECPAYSKFLQSFWVTATAQFSVLVWDASSSSQDTSDKWRFRVPPSILVLFLRGGASPKYSSLANYSSRVPQRLMKINKNICKETGEPPYTLAGYSRFCNWNLQETFIFVFHLKDLLVSGRVTSKQSMAILTPVLNQLPSREVTYPTLGKETDLPNCLWMGYASSRSVPIELILYPSKSFRFAMSRMLASVHGNALTTGAFLRQPGI